MMVIERCITVRYVLPFYENIRDISLLQTDNVFTHMYEVTNPRHWEIVKNHGVVITPCKMKFIWDKPFLI